MPGESQTQKIVHVSLVVGMRVVARESVSVAGALGRACDEPGAYALLDGGTVDDLRRARKVQPTKLRCRSCELPWGSYEREGRLGCPECWTSFRARLARELPSLHRGRAHLGKVPRRHRTEAVIARRREELQARMQAAINAERFEEAAGLRDELTRLDAVGA